VVPAKWCLVDFGKGKSAALIGILDMSIIVVEVVESGIAALPDLIVFLRVLPA